MAGSELNVTREIAATMEFTEAIAYADLLGAAPKAWNCAAEHSVNGWSLFAPRLDLLLFNRVIGCGVETPILPDTLRSMIERYRAAGIRNFGVQATPFAEGLHRELEQQGLTARDNWTKVYHTAGTLPTPDSALRISVTGPGEAELHAAIVCAAFGMPPMLSGWIASIVGRPSWQHYLAWDGDQAIGTAALFIHGEVGWLGIAGTLPTARRRGAQGALMAHRLREGARLGCRWFVTETGEELPQRPNPSFHNMLRAGFRVGYQRANYMR